MRHFFKKLYNFDKFIRRGMSDHKKIKFGAVPHLFERLFLISWENNTDCHITMPLSLKTMEVQVKEDE